MVIRHKDGTSSFKELQQLIRPLHRVEIGVWPLVHKGVVIGQGQSHDR